MKKNMLSKTLVFAIIVLFVGMSFVPSTGQIIGSMPLNIGGNTLYVGGDGPGNYSSIQEAIDAANDGDTVFVYNGTYTDFTVNKQLTIVGESREETVVQLGWSHTSKIRLKSDGIELTNFTFKGNPENVDRMLEITGNYCDVSYCTLVPASNDMPLNGIEIGWCSYVTISNCEIIGFPYWAITCREVTNCYFENCTIRNSYRGVYTMGPNQHVYVINCEIYNCGWDEFIDGAAVMMDVSSHNYVINCDIHDNAKGIDMVSSYNDIINCDIHDNAKGIDMGYTSHDNMIINNNFYYNSKTGLIIGGDCYDNCAYHNTFVSNSQGNAVDSGNNNIWDDDYPSGGNYWDDYTGEDNDGDGIGDTPYDIPGGDNQDNYPLMEPWNGENLPPNAPTITGPTNGKVEIEYEYSFNTLDPNGDDISSYTIDWDDDGGFEVVEGPFVSGEIITVNHTWFEKGTYSIRAKAKDVLGAESLWGFFDIDIDKSKNYNSQSNQQQSIEGQQSQSSSSPYTGSSSISSTPLILGGQSNNN